MSKWDKLLARIKTLSNDIRFEELKKILESYGYKMYSPKSGSSHFTFRKQGCASITIPKQKPIKKVYIELVREIVEQEEKDEKN
ncbi:MAG: toxin HicA [Roseburia sp.]|nr:toxin HicA [Roseburia sp.]